MTSRHMTGAEKSRANDCVRSPAAEVVFCFERYQRVGKMGADATTGDGIGQFPVASAFPRHEQTFPALTLQEIARIRRFGDIVRYQDGEPLFETGKPGSGMFLSLIHI